MTSGEKNDGKELQGLIEQMEENGFEVDGVIGDMAYSEKENLEYAEEKDIKTYCRLSKTVTHGNRLNPNKFHFNKDAGHYVCRGGHMSYKIVRKRHQKHAIDGQGSVESYLFDVEKCKSCPFRQGCYRDGAKTKSYSVTIKAHTHQKQEAFQDTDEFREAIKERYKVEAKNAELKHSYGLDRAETSGLLGMEIHGATAIFASNINRILRILDK